MSQILRQFMWLDVQAALLAAISLILAIATAQLMRHRLPAWRKGLWLCAMLAPIALVIIAALLPPSRAGWLPANWMRPTPAASASIDGQSSILQFAAFAYTLWIAANLLIEFSAALRLHRLLRRSRPVTDPAIVAAYTQLVRQMPCARLPRLLASDEAPSPFIAGGLFSGLNIVIPQSLADLPPRSLRAVLAHELAHARAGDPWIQRLTGLLRTALPFTWLSALVGMRMFWEDAAEQTSDLRAIRGSGLDPREYGAALKDLALADPQPLAALAFAAPLDDLTPATRRFARRLIARLGALKLADRWSETVAGYGGSAVRALLLGSAVWLLAAYSPLRNVLQDPRPAAPLAIATPTEPHHPDQPPPQPAPAKPTAAPKPAGKPEPVRPRPQRRLERLTPEKRAEY